ncbi:probable 3-beta-hydroxysteroid-Delta(8),Delta(7)-isomerase isoform X2 [Triticum aestivum]|nr:probable 3-beta-hydroxysteroid-Delta(8),Delta(7)-isomerase isoform X2 [Triticum aestivum]
MCWWAFTGLTHILIKGPFVSTPDFFAKGNPNYFDEVWKEYSKGDSRYIARDTATVTVEGITAVLEGPASLLAVYLLPSGSEVQLSNTVLQRVRCMSGSALRMLGVLHYGLLGWLHLLGQFILLLGVFHRRKQFMGCDTNSDRHKELGEDLRSHSSKRKGKAKSEPMERHELLMPTNGDDTTMCLLRWRQNMQTQLRKV